VTEEHTQEEQQRRRRRRPEGATSDGDGGTAAGDRQRIDARPRDAHTLGAAAAARRAAREVAELTGLDAETVIAVERCDEGWKVGVEVVETHRIPDSADILASYEVRLDGGGDLVSYRRTHRYARGQLYGGCR
jgi:gas vesicle protein GvpO